MNPIYGLIFLGLLLWLLWFVIGLITRKPKLIVAGLPAVLIVGFGIISSSIGPNPRQEFDAIFGAKNRATVSDLGTSRPIMSANYFMTFRMRPEDFNARILPRLEPGPNRPEFFEGQPWQWPDLFAAKGFSGMWYLESGETKVNLFYDPKGGIAYVLVRPPQW